MARIHLFSEDTNFDLQNADAVSTWIQSVIGDSAFELVEVNYIFCSDNHLLEINRQYLEHDYFTDIITFNNSENAKEIEADIFISIDRVKENADDSNQSFENELHRVMIHGILHLLGYDDKTEEQKKEMRRKEDSCLSLLDL